MKGLLVRLWPGEALPGSYFGLVQRLVEACPRLEVAVGKGVARAHPDYKALHGLFGRLVKLDQLLQLVAQGHWVFGPSILRPEQLLR